MSSVHPLYKPRRGMNLAAAELLELGRYAILGTENLDGSVHLTPVMYLFDQDRVYIETSAATLKARNVLARPRARILVQDPRVDGAAWVSGSGSADLLTGERARLIGRRIRARYLTNRGEEQIGKVMELYDDVVIVVVPDVWTAWDMGVFFSTLAEHGLPLDKSEEWFLPAG